MAQDKSIIKVPGVSSTQIVPKINTSAQEELVYNNGVYIAKASLNKTLPKSLVRILKGNNKIFLLDKETNFLERVIQATATLKQRIVIDVHPNGDLRLTLYDSIGYSASLLESGGIRLRESIGYPTSDVFLANASETNINKAFGSFRVSSTILNIGADNTENLSFNGKQLKLYKLKESIISNYLIKFAQPDYRVYNKVLDSNFFLRLKSVLSFKEGNGSEGSLYNNIKAYLFANWVLPSIDTLNTSFDVIKASKNIKNKLGGALTENDLVLYKTIPLINAYSKRFTPDSYDYQDVGEVHLYDVTTRLGNSERTFAVEGVRSYEQPAVNIIDDRHVLVFIPKVGTEIFALKVVKTFYQASGENSNSFTFQQKQIYGNIKPFYNYIDVELDADTQFSLNQSDEYKFYLYIISNELYDGFYEQDILSFTIPNDIDFSTATDGDYYVAEID